MIVGVTELPTYISHFPALPVPSYTSVLPSAK